MKSMSVEDVIAYQVFIKSKNFSTLLKMAIDKYCTDLDKITELQELLLQKPKELIEKYEKDDKISTIALALGISNIVDIYKKRKHIDKLQFIQLLHTCRLLLPKGLKDIKNASNVEKDGLDLLIYCLCNKHHFNYEDPCDVMWAISHDHWKYICDLLKEQGINI